MIDNFGRNITYLRLSVTDRCNLRCRYCMPPEGVPKQEHKDILTFEEIENAVAAAASLGICKVRITGGEPLVRREIASLCRRIVAIPGIGELCITTNSVLLPELAAELKASGVSRLNFSLDTLYPETYKSITCGGTLDQAVAGIEAAGRAGFRNGKVNTVLLRGINDGEIRDLASFAGEHGLQIRFIELMPVGTCAQFAQDHFLSADAVLRALPSLQPVGRDQKTELYFLPETGGTVGLIRPITHGFCFACDRLRLTADGYLRPCLLSQSEFPLKGLSRDEMRRALETAIRQKPECHALHLRSPEGAARNMHQIGG